MITRLFLTRRNSRKITQCICVTDKERQLNKFPIDFISFNEMTTIIERFACGHVTQFNGPNLNRFFFVHPLHNLLELTIVDGSLHIQKWIFYHCCPECKDGTATQTESDRWKAISSRYVVQFECYDNQYSLGCVHVLRFFNGFHVTVIPFHSIQFKVGAINHSSWFNRVDVDMLLKGRRRPFIGWILVWVFRAMLSIWKSDFEFKHDNNNHNHHAVYVCVCVHQSKRENILFHDVRPLCSIGIPSHAIHTFITVNVFLQRDKHAY